MRLAPGVQVAGLAWLRAVDMPEFETVCFTLLTGAPHQLPAVLQLCGSISI